jgi:hypothetical protein
MKRKVSRPDFETTVSDLALKITRLVEEPRYAAMQSDEWLRTLYERYTDRFIHDNNRIWTTGSIMIPISLAAFGALPMIACPKLIHLVILGLASVTLIVSWLVIAENHRAFQEKSMAWIAAIERAIGIEDIAPPKLQGNRLNRLLTFSGAVQKMRWTLTLAIVVGWIMVWIFWPRCA